MKILVTSTQSASFIQDDIRLLSKHFSVRHAITDSVSTAWRIRHLVRGSDVTFTWFASAYSAAVVFWAKRFRKKSVIVVGGVDLAKLPEIGYGIWLSWWKSILVRYALREASVVLAVDPSLMQRAKELARYDGSNISYLPTGYDPGVWRPKGTKRRQVLCVAKCENLVRAKVKGLPLLVEAARRLPDVPFFIVGADPGLVEELTKAVPANLHIIPIVERGELPGYYQKSKVYCQPSRIEGLPNSVCEAMLCGCIPVGTDVGGMRSALGGNGFLVPDGDADALVSALVKALDGSEEEGNAERDYIMTSFPLSRREAGLVAMLSEDAG